MDLKTWIKATDRVKTAKAAAKLCKVHYQTIGNLVRGEGKGMALSTFKRVAKGLRLTLAELAAMCANLSVQGLDIAQEAIEAESLLETPLPAAVATESTTAASLVASDIPAQAPSSPSSIQEILSRADELNNDADNG